MPKIRVLIVDDAVVVRSRVSKLLSSDPELEVVGVAANGHIALAKIPQVNPDVVILDVEMPEMNGLETLAAIRQTYPCLPVIMFSTSTRTGATATLEALARGATDYSTKPSNLGSVEAANQHICTDLIPKIKLFGAAAAKIEMPTSVTKAIAAPIRLVTEAVDVVAIGVSTGGPNALAVLLAEFPADLPVPILIVQHMPPMFTKLMTGMGQDGLRGCEYIRCCGGEILVQDRASSVVWGMPGFVANAGLADRVIPLDQMAGVIIRRLGKN